MSNTNFTETVTEISCGNHDLLAVMMQNVFNLFYIFVSLNNNNNNNKTNIEKFQVLDLINNLNSG